MALLEGEIITTVVDGKEETVNTAVDGDYVVCLGCRNDHRRHLRCRHCCFILDGVLQLGFSHQLCAHNISMTRMCVVRQANTRWKENYILSYATTSAAYEPWIDVHAQSDEELSYSGVRRRPLIWSSTLPFCLRIWRLPWKSLMAERMPTSCARTDTGATGQSRDCALLRVSSEIFPRSRTRIRALRATEEFLQRPGLKGTSAKACESPARVGQSKLSCQGIVLQRSLWPSGARRARRWTK